MYFPDYERFSQLARQGNLIPVFKEILADQETPVAVLKRFAAKPNLFLLESVEGGEKWGRYSFIGFDPRAVIRITKEEVIVADDTGVTHHEHGGDPLGFLREYLRPFTMAPLPGLPRFSGGAIGFFNYEIVHYWERIPRCPPDEFAIDEGIFYITDSLIIFDRIKHTIKVVVTALSDGKKPLAQTYQEAVDKIDGIISLLSQSYQSQPLPVKGELTINPAITYEEFVSRVRKAKEYILAGDIIQVVLSQRFQGRTTFAPVDIYRALRFVNPSPYLFFFQDGELALIGSSPETMVRLEDGQLELRPIAGTRPRGTTEAEDRRLADELLGDPKERAEHVMLVDLGRNDLGKVAAIGTVQVNQFMVVERYSHVMHLVSNIQAQLAPGKDGLDVIKATFPAGTLSGAPKVRAMEIIAELEGMTRGPYGGAVGYFSFNGNMDFCITIRTIVKKGEDFYIQTGAGIVADSDADAEYNETVNKAKAMMKALGLVSSRFDLSSLGG